MSRTRLFVAVLIAVGLASGCAASDPGGATSNTPAATETATPWVPDGGVLLSSATENGPENLSVPSGITANYLVDQTNVVTLIMDAPDGARVYDFLVAHLDAMGYQLTGQSTDSLTFSDGSWDGAYTSSASNSMLTLRRVE